VSKMTKNADILLN